MLMCCLSCAKADRCEQADRVEDYCINHEERPMTNADRIRQMTDEELAKLFSNSDCGYCKLRDTCYANGFEKDCEDAWLDWLKQEVQDGKG